MENSFVYLTLLTTLDKLLDVGEPEAARELIKQLISDYKAFSLQS